MVTIADVAARAGVGAGTVSRVLNNSPQVRADTRSRVLEAIEQLDYRPNPLARGLSSGGGKSFAVVVPLFAHPSTVERLRGVVAALDGTRHDLILLNAASPVQRDDNVDLLMRLDIADALVVMSLPPPIRRLARLVAAGVPVVLVDAQGTGVPTVVSDDVAGGRMATSHLVDLGHERIAFIGGEPDGGWAVRPSQRREDGYRCVLAEVGIGPPDDLVRYGRHDRDVARRMAGALLAERSRPTAVVASSDVQALGVLDAAADVGLRVPADLSVVGFDDLEVSAYAGLTTVRQPLHESGRLAAAILLDALGGGRLPAPSVHQLTLDLVERATTGPPPTTPRRAAARVRPRGGSLTGRQGTADG